MFDEDENKTESPGLDKSKSLSGQGNPNRFDSVSPKGRDSAGSALESGIRRFERMSKNQQWVVHKENCREFIEAIGVHNHLNNDDINKFLAELGDSKFTFR